MQVQVDVSNLFFTELESSGVTLSEKGGNRKLKIIVGDFEAQAIALGLENIKPPRPLTHDFMISVSNLSDLKYDKLVINDLKNNTYYAELYVIRNGIESIVDARPSDGIALAVRLNIPIFVEESVFVLSGNVENDDHKKHEIDSIENLEEQLENAVLNEEYEVAARLRDQIKNNQIKIIYIC